MSNHVTLVYTITRTGALGSALASTMAAVPVPADLLTALSVFVESDTTVDGGSTVARTIELRLTPTTGATAHLHMVAGSPKDSVGKAFVVNTAGLDFVTPPDVILSGGGAQVLAQAKGRALLEVINVSVPTAGSGYHAPTTSVAFLGGLPPALFLNEQTGRNQSQKAVYPVPNGPPYCVQNITITKTGRGYSAATQVTFIGGNLQPGGFHAVARVSAFGPNGEILGIQILQPGYNYAIPPTIGFFDPGGAPPAPVQLGNEAKAVVSMAAGVAAQGTVTLVGGDVTAIVMTSSGQGYIGVPYVVVTDTAAITPGSGAVLLAHMGVGSIQMLYPGQGYVIATPPTVTLEPHFATLFPTAGDQRAPFWNLMTTAISQACAAPVVASAPALS